MTSQLQDASESYEDKEYEVDLIGGKIVYI